MDDAAGRTNSMKARGVGKNARATSQPLDLVNAIPQIVWRARPDGSPEYFNERWYQFTGADRSAFGQGWKSFVHPDDLQNLLGLYEIEVRAVEPYSSSCRLKDVRGHYRWFLIQAIPIRGQDNQIMNWVGTCTDMHDIKAKEEELRESIEREQAALENTEAESRAKDEFLAIVSHELRTPLNAILGWVTALRKSGPIDSGIIHGIDSIERSAKIQAQIIGDILDISRTRLGKMSLERRPVKPVEIVDAAIETVRPDADVRGLRIERSLCSSDFLVIGDPRRLQQVVWNLLSNAIKFTPEGGLVEVTVERLDNEINITVSDTGEGVDPQILPIIFNRFCQADTSTNNHGGLGLGLSIVRQLVELHGGRVSARSEGLGSGTAFTVSLPVLDTDIISSSFTDESDRQ